MTKKVHSISADLRPQLAGRPDGTAKAIRARNPRSGKRGELISTYLKELGSGRPAGRTRHSTRSCKDTAVRQTDVDVSQKGFSSA